MHEYTKGKHLPVCIVKDRTSKSLMQWWSRTQFPRGYQMPYEWAFSLLSPTDTPSSRWSMGLWLYVDSFHPRMCIFIFDSLPSSPFRVHERFQVTYHYLLHSIHGSSLYQRQSRACYPVASHSTSFSCSFSMSKDKRRKQRPDDGPVTAKRRFFFKQLSNASLLHCWLENFTQDFKLIPGLSAAVWEGYCLLSTWGICIQVLKYQIPVLLLLLGMAMMSLVQVQAVHIKVLRR